MKDMVLKIHNLIPSHISNKDIYIVCIGTDRSTGDSYGPFVGTFLESEGIKNVIGTLENPLHAVNLQERLEKEVPANVFTIAIDACLGSSNNVGAISVSKKPVRPGAGVDRNLPLVGDMSIEATVNVSSVSSFMDLMTLNSTRLHTVMNMATKTAEALKKALSRRI